MSSEHLVRLRTAARRLLSERRAWPALAAAAVVLVAALALSLPRGAAEDRSAAQALPPAVPTGTLAPEIDPGAASTLASDADLGGTLLDVGLKLAVTIAVLYLTLLVVRRLSPRAGAGPRGNLAIVESLRLGGSGALHLVRVGDRQILVGATATQITLLGEAGAPLVEPDRGPSGEPAESPFLAQLRAAIGTGTAERASP